MKLYTQLESYNFVFFTLLREYKDGQIPKETTTQVVVKYEESIGVIKPTLTYLPSRFPPKYSYPGGLLKGQLHMTHRHGQ